MPVNCWKIMIQQPMLRRLNMFAERSARQAPNLLSLLYSASVSSSKRTAVLISRYSAEKGIFGCETAESGERGDAFFVAVLHHEPAGWEGEGKHPEEEDPCEDELECEGQTQ